MTRKRIEQFIDALEIVSEIGDEWEDAGAWPRHARMKDDEFFCEAIARLKNIGNAQLSKFEKRYLDLIKMQ